MKGGLMSDPRKIVEKPKEKDFKDKDAKDKEFKELRENKVKELKERKEFKEKELKDVKELKEDKEIKESKELEGPFQVEPLRQAATLESVPEAAGAKIPEKIKPEKEGKDVVEKIKPEKEFETQKIKPEKENLEKVKPEKEWKEWKELEKVKPEKEKSEKEIFEGPGEFTVEERLERIESAVAQIAHFIQADLRPDLSQGALRQEPDAGTEEPAAKKEPGSRRRRS
jgi:hypothetical protein